MKLDAPEVDIASIVTGDEKGALRGVEGGCDDFRVVSLKDRECVVGADVNATWEQEGNATCGCSCPWLRRE